jgi:hypothetical protein
LFSSRFPFVELYLDLKNKPINLHYFPEHIRCKVETRLALRLPPGQLLSHDINTLCNLKSNLICSIERSRQYKIRQQKMSQHQPV